ncbi:MAG: dUTP diphosphatase [Candidatus Aenigmarchaeota archaeon]|nr:dUTP diphosphatase [Candidatus Aenigmarchaeota archaeon]
MNLKEIAKFQRDFDKRHGWDWSKSSKEEKIKHLQYGTIALAGEIGEFANTLKKILREFNFSKEIPKEEHEKLKEEIIDIFIYFIKIADQLLELDIEKEYLKKMEKNEKRFAKFKCK